MSNPARTSTQVLKAARWLIDNIGWCQNQYQTTDDKGKPIAFCAWGAVGAVEIDGDWRLIDRAMQRLHKAAPHGNVVSFNDRKSTTKEKVLKVFDRALKSKPRPARIAKPAPGYVDVRDLPKGT